MIIYISPKNMVAEDNHLYFAYKSPLGLEMPGFKRNLSEKEIYRRRSIIIIACVGKVY